MAATTEDRTRDGALLRQLRDTTTHSGRSGAFGFYTGTQETAKKRTLKILARVRAGRELAADMKRAVADGADAVEIELADRDMKTVIEAIATIKTPCGVLIDGPLVETLTPESLETLDWLHLGLTAPGHLLTKSGPTRILTLRSDLQPNRLPGLATVPADIVVVDTLSPTPLTVEMLLSIGTIGGASSAPTLLGPGIQITSTDLAAVRDLGVDGLIVSNPEALPLLIKAIENL